MHRLLALCLATAVFTPACDKDNDAPAEDKKPDVKWPEKPADGSNMVLEVLSHDKESAKIRVFNFADKAVTSLHIRQHFDDAADKELDTFPFSQVGNVVGAKEVAEIDTVMMGVPDEMKKVRATIKKIEYKGGEKWEAKPAG